ncbi:MAG: ferrous iron transport protein B [Candidatus Melainabacteria bacterium]|nr:ferrous iron transport protein B [Candidatus Melainabacteria bacterium]
MQVHVRDPAALRVSTETVRRKIVLAGNPNVGKSVIFNALTGENVDVSNYPGTTIDISYGRLGPCDLIDTPGVYGISSFNDEERAARAIILKADLIVNIVSALSLDRDLFLTLQLLDMGKPMLLVLNQWDEARHRELKIDTHLLSTLLGINVITAVAVRGEGIPAIKDSLHLARAGNVSLEIGQLLAPLLSSGVLQEHAVLILEGDDLSATEYGIAPGTWRAELYRARRQLVNEIVTQTVVYGSKTKDLSIRLGRLMLHPVYGLFIALMVCYLIFYQLLGILIAGNLVDFTEKKAMRAYYEPLVRRIAATVFPCTITIGENTFNFRSGTASAKHKAAAVNAALAHTQPDKVEYNFWPQPSLLTLIGNCLVGEYGILTLTVTYLLGLLMPLVLGFYFGLSLLEDSGYLPRLAVLVDRLMNKLGLNGRAIIPLILGLGCVTMATITTRLLSTKREKIIASALLGIAIPCSAQLGVVSGTLAKAGGLFAWTIYITVVGSVLAITGVLLNMILPGKSGALLIDLPPLRVPRVDNVVKKTWRKSWNFLKDASVPFFLAALLVTFAQASGLLDLFIHVLQPITISWLNLPSDPRIATTFILGIVRRDFAAFGLTDVALSPVQAVVAMIVVTLFVPCIATVGVMMKERGVKIALSIWFGSWLCAFVIGGLLAQILPPLFHLAGAS